MLHVVVLGTVFSTLNVTAKEQDRKTTIEKTSTDKEGAEITVIATPPSNASQQLQRQSIDKLSTDVNKIYEKLENQSRDQRAEESKTDEIDKRIGSLRYSVEDAWDGMFDKTSTFLIVLITLTALFISAIGVGFVILAVFGFKGIKEVKQDITNDLASKYQETIQQGFITETSKIREEFNSEIRELSSKIDSLYLEIRMRDKGESAVVQTNKPSATTSQENAFEDD